MKTVAQRGRRQTCCALVRLGGALFFFALGCRARVLVFIGLGQ